MSIKLYKHLVKLNSFGIKDKITLQTKRIQQKATSKPPKKTNFNSKFKNLAEKCKSNNHIPKPTNTSPIKNTSVSLHLERRPNSKTRVLQSKKSFTNSQKILKFPKNQKSQFTYPYQSSPSCSF